MENSKIWPPEGNWRNSCHAFIRMSQAIRDYMDEVDYNTQLQAEQIADLYSMMCEVEAAMQEALDL